MKVAIQGYPGSYHHQAADQFFNQKIEIVPCENFVQVFEALEAGVVERAVVAIENSLFGSINDTYDLLLKHKPTIVGEVYLHVALQLLAKDGVEIDELTDVYSQAPALAEAKIYLREHAPSAKLHEYADTALSAKYVASSPSPTIGAIASAKAGELYNLNTVAENIEDHKHNYTRFFVLSRDKSRVVEADKTTLILHTSHQPGALYAALGAFADNHINLSKIESRPVVDDHSWEYIFYVDIEVSDSDDRAARALKALKEAGVDVTDLGSYVRASLPNGIR